MSIFIQIMRRFIEHWILNVIQFWFNYPVYFLKRIWNYDDVHHTSIDQYQSMQYCKLTRSIPYGSHPREKFHLLEPTQHTKIRGNLFYVHGGGFVTSCREMYYNSFTYLCRRGYRVFIVDYPLSPQSRHPYPTLSILRCLNYLRSNTKWKIKELHMIGDSAGANLILLSTSIIQNSNIQSHFQRFLSSKESATMSKYIYPKILSCVSIYGMISKKTGSQASFPMGLGFSFLWQCITNYNNDDDAEIFPVSFDDVLDSFLSSGNGDAKLNFPPVQFLVGDKDPLLQDSLFVYNKMKSNHYNTTELHVYQGGFHGFFGVPPDWQLGRWKLACRPCSEDIYAFLNTYTVEPRSTKISLMGQRTIGNDW